MGFILDNIFYVTFYSQWQHVNWLISSPTKQKKNHVQFPPTPILVTQTRPTPVAAQLAPTAQSRTHSPMRYQGAPASLVSMEMDSLAHVSWSPWHQLVLNVVLSVVFQLWFHPYERRKKRCIPIFVHIKPLCELIISISPLKISMTSPSYYYSNTVYGLSFIKINVSRFLSNQT